MREARQLPEDQPPVNDLERLVELEARLDELLEASRSEAATLIAQARDRTARADQDWASDFEAARRELAARLVEERDHELSRIREEADRLSAQYETRTDEEIDALARWVVSELRASRRG